LEEGTACRLYGKIPVLKGNGDRLTITVGKSLPIGNMIQHLGAHQRNLFCYHHKSNYCIIDGNISHRIERFHFGQHIWGLVTPLAGNEQVAMKCKLIIFVYLIKDQFKRERPSNIL
jgi:hypothetical protein